MRVEQTNTVEVSANVASAVCVFLFSVVCVYCEDPAMGISAKETSIMVGNTSSRICQQALNTSFSNQTLTVGDY